jgi:hypothetical protein
LLDGVFFTRWYNPTSSFSRHHYHLQQEKMAKAAMEKERKVNADEKTQ